MGKEDKSKLNWRDYIALTIASLETIMLPMILLLLAIFLIAVLFGVLFV